MIAQQSGAYVEESAKRGQRGREANPTDVTAARDGAAPLLVTPDFSVTRERIRQIEAKALRKLKHPSRSRKMRSFLDQWLLFERRASR